MGREPLLFVAVLIREIAVLVNFSRPVSAGILTVGIDDSIQIRHRQETQAIPADRMIKQPLAKSDRLSSLHVARR